MVNYSKLEVLSVFLEVEDYKDVRITKIKPWCIHFKYHDRRFFVRSNYEEYEHFWTLHEKVYTCKDKFKVNLISSVYTSCDDYILSTIRLKSSIRGTRDKLRYTHNQIDIKYFIKSLEKIGLLRIKRGEL